MHENISLRSSIIVVIQRHGWKPKGYVSLGLPWCCLRFLATWPRLKFGDYYAVAFKSDCIRLPHCHNSQPPTLAVRDRIPCVESLSVREHVLTYVPGHRSEVCSRHPQCNLSKWRMAFRFFSHCRKKNINDGKFSVNATSATNGKYVCNEYFKINNIKLFLLSNKRTSKIVFMLYLITLLTSIRSRTLSLLITLLTLSKFCTFSLISVSCKSEKTTRQTCKCFA